MRLRDASTVRQSPVRPLVCLGMRAWCETANTGVTGLIRLELIDWRWVMRLAVTLLALAVLPILLGMTLDRQLQTSPVLTLFMLLLGLNLGIFIIARQVAALFLEISPIQPESASESPGGDPC